MPLPPIITVLLSLFLYLCAVSVVYVVGTRRDYELIASEYIYKHRARTKLLQQQSKSRIKF